jgi:NADPH:quinone reductase
MTVAPPSHAIQIDRYGPPEVMEWRAVDLPPLGADEVRLRTLVAAVNRADLEIRSGHWPVQRDDPFPYTPGLEVVGEVEAVGPAVTSVRPGERAITMMQRLGGIHGERPGGYAEHVTVAADVLATLPADVDPQVLAALGLVAVTAAEGLRRLALGPGARVVVQGASGGVGSAAVAMASARGAEVIAVLPRAGKERYVRELGASTIVRLDGGGLVKALGARSVDAVLETLGARTFTESVAVLRRGGRLCLVGALTGEALTLSAWDLLHELELTGWSSENLTGRQLRDHVGGIVEQVRRGRLRPPATRVFPLPSAAAAHRCMERGELVGRALLVP